MSFCEHSYGYSTSFLIDPWNFHVLQYPWKFHVSSTAVTCLAWIFSGIDHCFRYVFVLNWVAILRIFKTANIGKLTFLLPFFRQEIREKTTKNEEFQCAVTQVVLVKKS